MKKSLILSAVGALAVASMSSMAYAGNTIVQNDVGQFVRQGRFLKPVLTASPRSEGTGQQAFAQGDTKLIVDKGDLGTYVRKGSVLKPVLQIGPQGWASAANPVPVSTVIHEHGLNGKEHKNIAHKRAN